jgi:hypothetical protein
MCITRCGLLQTEFRCGPPSLVFGCHPEFAAADEGSASSIRAVILRGVRRWRTKSKDLLYIVHMADLSAQPTSIQSIYSWYTEDRLYVNRRYQRKLVWTLEEKQKLIESILKKYPLF